MPVPPEISKLVERFDAQSEAYQSGKYNEAQIRAEFIDPLFKALGWDTTGSTLAKFYLYTASKC